MYKTERIHYLSTAAHNSISSCNIILLTLVMVCGGCVHTLCARLYKFQFHTHFKKIILIKSIKTVSILHFSKVFLCAWKWFHIAMLKIEIETMNAE